MVEQPQKGQGIIYVSDSFVKDTEISSVLNLENINLQGQLRENGAFEQVHRFFSYLNPMRFLQLFMI